MSQGSEDLIYEAERIGECRENVSAIQARLHRMFLKFYLDQIVLSEGNSK